MFYTTLHPSLNLNEFSLLKSVLKSVDFSIFGASQRSLIQTCTLARGAHSHFVKALKGRKCSAIWVNMIVNIDGQAWTGQHHRWYVQKHPQVESLQIQWAQGSLYKKTSGRVRFHKEPSGISWKTSQSHPVLLKKEMMLDCSSLKSLLQSVDFSIFGPPQTSSPRNCTLARGGPGHFVKALKPRECSKLQQDIAT